MTIILLLIHLGEIGRVVPLLILGQTIIVHPVNRANSVLVAAKINNGLLGTSKSWQVW